MSSSYYIVTHGNCLDGFTAAWVARRFVENIDETPEIFFGLYGSPPPNRSAYAGKHVVMTDISYPRDQMEVIALAAESLTVYDHHHTAQEALDGFEREMREQGQNVVVEFDMKRSGAGITWDALNVGATRPPLVDYVEDRDLWNFALPQSREVNAYISTLPLEFPVWEGFGTLTEIPEEAIIQGIGILSYLDEYSRVVDRDAIDRTLEGHPVRLVNAHYKSCSEVLNWTLENHPEIEIAMSWFRRKDGVYQYSLRSREGGPHVGEISKAFGGGGHPRAAGFTRMREIFA